MNRLKELRKQAGLSLRELQKYVGIDFSRLAVIEKNDANIEQKTLDKLLVFFGVNYSYFYGGDGLIDFYDNYQKKFYPLAYNQFKNILDNAIINIQIINSKVIRILSEEDLNKISNIMLDYEHSINRKILVENFIEKIDKLSTNEIKQIQSDLNEYFDSKNLY